MEKLVCDDSFSRSRPSRRYDGEGRVGSSCTKLRKLNEGNTFRIVRVYQKMDNG